MEKEFNNLDKQVALMNQELKEIGKKVTEGFEANSSEHKEIVKNSIEQNRELIEMFNKAIEKSDCKFQKALDDRDKVTQEVLNQKASKWVEDWLVWAGRIVVGAVILALVSLVVITK